MEPASQWCWGSYPKASFWLNAFSDTVLRGGNLLRHRKILKATVVNRLHMLRMSLFTPRIASRDLQWIFLRSPSIYLLPWLMKPLCCSVTPFRRRYWKIDWFWQKGDDRKQGQQSYKFKDISRLACHGFWRIDGFPLGYYPLVQEHCYWKLLNDEFQAAKHCNGEVFFQRHYFGKMRAFTIFIWDTSRITQIIFVLWSPVNSFPELKVSSTFLVKPHHHNWGIDSFLDFAFEACSVPSFAR